MSPINQLSILALAATALAVPGYRDGWHSRLHHQHHHHHSSGRSWGMAPTGTASSGWFPHPTANSTGIWGSTAAFSTPTLPMSLASASSSVSDVAVSPADITTASAAGTTSCTTDVTTTSTVQVTVTVTASQPAAPSVVISASSPASSPVRSTSTVHLQSTMIVSAVPSSTEVSAIIPSVSSAWSALAAVVPSTAEAQKAHFTTSTSAAAPSSTGSSSSGKRGLAYNDVSLTDAFSGNDLITWGYNWASSGTGLASNVKFVPLLWGATPDFTDSWSENANAAIQSGSTHLMSFNEPDDSTQANLSPAAAAAAYKLYMMPFANQAGVKLGAPAVTNGGGAMGLTWLSEFLDACTGCQIDFVSLHWYNSYTAADDFKSQVQNGTDISGGKPVFVSEFGCTDGSDENISDFLQDVMPWMDSQDFVEGYAYFMVSDGLLVTGDAPSSYGSTYATYTG